MFESARLDDDHVLAGFDCGKESLNGWLVEPARRADSSGLAHVYVWTRHGGYSRIPGYLIARLAIDASLRGHGYGEQLLLDVLGKAVAALEIGGGRLIVVDAIDGEAQSFYEHYHFVPVRSRERRLVMKPITQLSFIPACFVNTQR